MSGTADALQLALGLARELEKRSLPYAIGGALALGAWSDPRGTKDVDVNVFVTDERLDEVFDAVEAASATLDRAKARREAADRGMFVATFPNGMRLDMFTPSIDFSWEAARTRARLVSRGQEASFLSAEAIAIFKLLFFRGRDRVDLERLVRVQPALDVDYVRRNLIEMFGEDDERVRFWDETVATQRLPGST